MEKTEGHFVESGTASFAALPELELLLHLPPSIIYRTPTFMSLFTLSLPRGTSISFSRFLFPGVGKMRSLNDSYTELEAFVIAPKAWLNVEGISFRYHAITAKLTSSIYLFFDCIMISWHGSMRQDLDVSIIWHVETRMTSVFAVEAWNVNLIQAGFQPCRVQLPRISFQPKRKEIFGGALEPS